MEYKLIRTIYRMFDIPLIKLINKLSTTSTSFRREFMASGKYECMT